MMLLGDYALAPVRFAREALGFEPDAKQALVLMLSVQVDGVLGDLAEDVQRRRRVVDERTRVRRRDLAPHDEHARRLRVDAVRLQ